LKIKEIKIVCSFQTAIAETQRAIGNLLEFIRNGEGE
jgi:hypothetical protein